MAYVFYAHVYYGIIVVFQGNSEYPICVKQVVTFKVLVQTTHGSKIYTVLSFEHEP